MDLACAKLHSRAQADTIALTAGVGGPVERVDADVVSLAAAFKAAILTAGDRALQLGHLNFHDFRGAIPGR